MFKTARLTTSLLRSSRPITCNTPKYFCSTAIRTMDVYKKAGNRKDEQPKHEMVHFAGLLSSKREFGDFRTVLHTGLYSQIFAMEGTAGVKIGDEVCLPNPMFICILFSNATTL